MYHSKKERKRHSENQNEEKNVYFSLPSLTHRCGKECVYPLNPYKYALLKVHHPHPCLQFIITILNFLYFFFFLQKHEQHTHKEKKKDSQLNE